MIQLKPRGAVPAYRLSEKPPKRYTQNDVFNFLYENPEGKKFSDIKGSNPEIANNVLTHHERAAKQYDVDLPAYGRAYPELYAKLMRSRENKKNQKKKLKADKPEESQKRVKVDPQQQQQQQQQPRQQQQVPLRPQDVEAKMLAHCDYAEERLDRVEEILKQLRMRTRSIREKLFPSS